MNDLLIGSLHVRILFQSTWVWVVLVGASYDLSAFEQQAKRNFTRLEVLWAEFEQIKVNLVEFT